MFDRVLCGRLSITKKFEFHAAHHLPNHEGKCKQSHGHSFLLEISVAAKDNILLTEGPETNMIIDFSRLKEIVNREIIGYLDHTDLNDMFEHPTSEFLVRWIASNLIQVLPGLVRVRLYETSTSYAEWSVSR
jgi:6-pyruvoyltetrahydropterin/6-carboxytetrahydropterin synthase